MKKLICITLLMLAMSGCSNEEAKTMVCESVVESSQMKSSVVQRITYEGDNVIKQKNETQLRVYDQTSYDQLMSIVENVNNQYLSIKGTTYTYESDDETYTINETIELDLASMNLEDRKKVLSYESDGDLNIDEIKDILQEQGYTCKK